MHHGFCVLPTAPSPRSTLRARAQAPAKARTAGGINPAGTISGYYLDGSNVYHGFLRARDGTITTFDVPGAGTGSGQGTLGENINVPGAIDGTYIDASDVYHGFLRSKHGRHHHVRRSGRGHSVRPRHLRGIDNPAGAITGYYIDANNVVHGYLRNSVSRGATSSPAPRSV